MRALSLSTSVAAFVLIVLVLAVGGPTLDNGLYADDLVLVHDHALGGLETLSPIGEIKAEDADSYWLREQLVQKALIPVGGSFAVYRPIVPTLLQKLGALAFGPRLWGYHLMMVLSQLLLVLAVWRVLHALGQSQMASFCATAMVAVHPLLAVGLNSPGALRYFLAAAFALLALSAGIRRSEHGGRRWVPAVWLGLGLLCDMSALAGLAMLLLYRPQTSDETDGELKKRVAAVRNAALVVAVVLLVFRLLLPLASGVYSAEGWYQQLMLTTFLDVFGVMFSDIAQMLTLIPPQLLLILPATALMAGLIGVVIFLAAVWRSLVSRSRLARLGLVCAVTAWLVNGFGPMRLEDAALPLVGMVLILLDVAQVVGARIKRRGLRLALIVLLGLYFLPTAIAQNLAWQDWSATYSQTSRSLAEQLDEALPELAPNSRVLLVNVWGGASLLPYDWRLLSGRADVDMRILTIDPALVSFGLPIPDNPTTIWMQPYLRWPEADTAVQIKALGPRDLAVKLEKGVFLASMADLTPDYKLATMPRGRWLNGSGMKIRGGPWHEGSPAGFLFRFDVPLETRPTVVMVWRGGRWQQVALDYPGQSPKN